MQYPFGEKLRQVRETRRITMREMANAIGVSESLISQIERSKVSPSVDTLLAMADYLQVDLDYLFAELRKPKTAHVVRQGERRHFEQQGVVYELLNILQETPDTHAVEAFVLRLSPGAHTGSKSFGHPGRELGLVLQGQASLTYGGKTYDLFSGDSVDFSADAPHTLENTGASELQAVWITTPPKKDFFA